MKFEELLYQPVQAPLEGFDKAVATGFEIAQNQERLRQAQEQINLKKEELQSEYVLKGIGALSALSKSKGAARKVFGNVMLNLFKKGNLQIDPDTEKLLLADVEYSKKINDVLSLMDEKGITDPQARIGFLQDVVGADPDKVDAQIELEKTKLKTLEETKVITSKEGMKAVFDLQQEAAKGLVSQERESSKYIGDVAEKFGGLSEEMLQMLNKYKDNTGLQAGLLRGYVASIAAPAKNIEDNLKNIKDPTADQQKSIDSILNTIAAAKRDYADPNKRASAIDSITKANVEFGKILSAQKSSGDKAELLQKKRFEEARDKDAFQIARKIEEDISKYYDNKTAEINSAVGIITKPGATWNDVKSVVGQFAKLGGESGARLSDQDASRTIGTGLGVRTADVLNWFTIDGASPDEATLSRLKTNARMFLNTLAAEKEKKIIGRLKLNQSDPRLGKHFLPGGSAYNGLSARYPDIFSKIEAQKQKAAVRSGVIKSSSAPITVNRSDVILKLKQKALSKGFKDFSPSENQIDAAYQQYINKYGADGVIINKNK